MLCVAAMPAAADAAIKVREGDVNHWIEHYQRERQPRQPAQTAADQPASAKQRGAAPPTQEKELKR